MQPSIEARSFINIVSIGSLIPYVRTISNLRIGLTHIFSKQHRRSQKFTIYKGHFTQIHLRTQPLIRDNLFYTGLRTAQLQR